jgi:hypothetical protein
MQIERIALLFGKRRSFVESGMIQEGKTVQLRPDRRFRHGSCLLFSLSGDALFRKPTTAYTRNERHHGRTAQRCPALESLNSKL